MTTFNITEASTFDATVRGISADELLLGGDGAALGPLNYAAQNLANRTKWLYDNKQGLAANLTAFAALASFGMVTLTSAGNVSARTITGTANEITVTNGSGVSGNPTLSLPTALNFTGKTVTGGTFTIDGGTSTISNITTAMFAASVIDTDGTLSSNSDTRLATQKAVKTYVDNAVTGLLDFKGSTDASGNPNYPVALKGDAYVVSVAGKIGGASGVSVDIGDVYAASADNAGGTQAAVGTSWFVLEHNLVGALLSANNLSDLANAGTARGNLGGTTVGQSFFTLTNPGAITFTRINADNSVSALSAAAFLTAIGAGADSLAVHLAGSETITGTKTFTVLQKINLNATAMPAAQTGSVLQLANVDGTPSRIEVSAFGAQAFVTTIGYGGTNALPTALISGTQIGGYNSWGYNGAAVVGPVATFRAFASETWAVGKQGSYAEIAVTANATTTLTTSIRFENDGGITVGPTVTGSSKGAGTINAVGLYIAGVSLGTIATQNANSVAITGGAIDGTTIGATTTAASGLSSAMIGVVSGSGLATFTGSTGGTPVLQVLGVGGPNSSMANVRFSASVNGPLNILAHSRGATIGDYTIVADADSLGRISWQGSDGTDFVDAARIETFVSGTPANNIVPTEIRFSTMTTAGALTSAMSIGPTQAVGIGTTLPDARLTVAAVDATTDQVRLRSARAAIVTGNIIGGIEFMSNDTNLTAPGTVVARVRGVARATHTASVLTTDLEFHTTTTLTTAATMTLTGAGRLLINNTTDDGVNNLQVSGPGAFTGNVTLTKSANTGSLFSAINANAGASAFASFLASNDNGSGYIAMNAMGTAYTTSGAYVQDAGVIDCAAGLSGGLSIISQVAPIRLYSGGAAVGNLVATWSATSLTLADPYDIVCGTTTGTKFGTGTTQKIGFFNATPVVKQATITQTYSTTATTLANDTATDMATTAATQVTPFGFATGAQADAIATKFNALRVDVDNLKQVFNTVVDSLQALGFNG